MYLPRVNKLSMFLSALVLAGCQTTAAPPPTEVSKAYDGHWNGTRINTTGDSKCIPTTMKGTVKDGYLSFNLQYNSTTISGWIAKDGTLTLDHDNLDWTYNFTGTAKEGEISGKWSVGNANCEGTWFLNRT